MSIVQFALNLCHNATYDYQELIDNSNQSCWSVLRDKTSCATYEHLIRKKRKERKERKKWWNFLNVVKQEDHISWRPYSSLLYGMWSSMKLTLDIWSDFLLYIYLHKYVHKSQIDNLVPYIHVESVEISKLIYNF